MNGVSLRPFFAEACGIVSQVLGEAVHGRSSVADPEILRGTRKIFEGSNAQPDPDLIHFFRKRLEILHSTTSRDAQLKRTQFEEFYGEESFSHLLNIRNELLNDKPYKISQSSEIIDGKQYFKLKINFQDLTLGHLPVEFIFIDNSHEN